MGSLFCLGGPFIVENTYTLYLTMAIFNQQKHDHFTGICFLLGFPVCVTMHETCSWADRRGFLCDDCRIVSFLVPIDRPRLCKYDFEDIARRKSIISVSYVILTPTNEYVLRDGEAQQVTIIVVCPRQLDLTQLVSPMHFLTKGNFWCDT